MDKASGCLRVAIVLSIVAACGGDGQAPPGGADSSVGGPDGGGGGPDGGGGGPDGGGGGPDATSTAPDAGAPAPDAGPGAPVGAECVTSPDCEGGYCITDGDGFPDGYCTHLMCDLSAPTTDCLPYGGDALCLDTGGGFGVCFDACDPAAPDCRVAYECVAIGGGQGICLPAPVCGNGQLEQGEECEPPSTPTCDANCQGTGTDPIGAPCVDATTCAGDFCIADADGWPMGYCTEADCDLGDPENSCLPYGGDGLCLDVGDPGAPFGACFDRCDPASSDCRPQYMCQAIGGGYAVCVPAPVCGNGTVEQGEECEPPNTPTCDASCQGTGTAPIGDPCTAATDCAGNLCVTEADGWPGGYCSQMPCDLGAPDTSCLPYGGDGLCLDAGAGQGVCVDQCMNDVDCRAMYSCVNLGGGVRVCLP